MPEKLPKGGKRSDLGIYVRSKWEANFARYLKWMVEKEEIKSWRYEPMSFEFRGIKRGTRFEEKNPYKGRGRAHPYPPGSGPEGEKCGTCAARRCRPYRGTNYYKCQYMKHAWSCGLGTDIRLKDAACFLWKPDKGRTE